MKTITRRKYVDGLCKDAKNAFAQHTLVAEHCGERNWMIRGTPGTCNRFGAVEIFRRVSGGIVVSGDVDTVGFSSRLGNREFSDYAMEKAASDMGADQSEWCDAVMRGELPDVAGNIVDMQGRPLDDEQQDAIERAADAADQEEFTDIMMTAFDCFNDEPSDIYDVGMVPTRRVVYAHYAQARLAELLETKP